MERRFKTVTVVVYRKRPPKPKTAGQPLAQAQAQLRAISEMQKAAHDG